MLKLLHKSCTNCAGTNDLVQERGAFLHKLPRTIDMWGGDG